jgi:hypothetical protein
MVVAAAAVERAMKIQEVIMRAFSAHFGHRDHSDRSIVITEIGGS